MASILKHETQQISKLVFLTATWVELNLQLSIVWQDVCNDLYSNLGWESQLQLTFVLDEEKEEFYIVFMWHDTCMTALGTQFSKTILAAIHHR